MCIAQYVVHTSKTYYIINTSNLEQGPWQEKFTTFENKATHIAVYKPPATHIFEYRVLECSLGKTINRIQAHRANL